MKSNFSFTEKALFLNRQASVFASTATSCRISNNIKLIFFIKKIYALPKSLTPKTNKLPATAGKIMLISQMEAVATRMPKVFVLKILNKAMLALLRMPSSANAMVGTTARTKNNTETVPITCHVSRSTSKSLKINQYWIIKTAYLPTLNTFKTSLYFKKK